MGSGVDRDLIALARAVDESHWLALLALADALEERGDGRCRGVRWLSDRRKFPCQVRPGVWAWLPPTDASEGRGHVLRADVVKRYRELVPPKIGFRPGEVQGVAEAYLYGAAAVSAWLADEDVYKARRREARNTFPRLDAGGWG